MEPAITVIKTPAAEFRCQCSLAPLDRRLLRHPAGQHGQAQAITGQLLQLIDFLGREKTLGQGPTIQGPIKALEVHPNGHGGIAQQHPITAMAEADPTALQLRGLTRWTVQRHRRRVTAQGFRQHLPHGRPAMPIALATQGGQGLPPENFLGREHLPCSPLQGQEPQLDSLPHNRQQLLGHWCWQRWLQKAP